VSLKPQRVILLFLLPFLLPPSTARGAGFDFTQLGSANNDSLRAVLQTVAFGAEHHPHQGAQISSQRRGFTLGSEATAVIVPSSFQRALDTLGSTSQFPKILPVVRLGVRLRLLSRVELGASALSYLQYSLLGGHLQWQLLRPRRFLPALAVRGSYHKAGLDIATTSAWAADVVVSIPFWILEPYLGYGTTSGKGSLELTASEAASLPSGVSTSQSFSGSRWFAGLPIRIKWLELALLYAENPGQVRSASAQVALRF
jgi:hypothetical protein